MTDIMARRWLHRLFPGLRNTPKTVWPIWDPVDAFPHIHPGRTVSCASLMWLLSAICVQPWAGEEHPSVGREQEREQEREREGNEDFAPVELLPDRQTQSGQVRSGSCAEVSARVRVQCKANKGSLHLVVTEHPYVYWKSFQQLFCPPRDCSASVSLAWPKNEIIAVPLPPSRDRRCVRLMYECGENASSSVHITHHQFFFSKTSLFLSLIRL